MRPGDTGRQDDKADNTSHLCYLLYLLYNVVLRCESALSSDLSSVDAVVEERKAVVFLLDAGDPALIDAAAADRLLKRAEAREMVVDAPVGVGGVGLRLEDERPVRGLGQQQLPGHLVEQPLAQRVGMAVRARRVGHALGHLVE